MQQNKTHRISNKWINIIDKYINKIDLYSKKYSYSDPVENIGCLTQI